MHADEYREQLEPRLCDAPSQPGTRAGSVRQQAAMVLAQGRGQSPAMLARFLADAGLLVDPAVRMLDAVARVTPCTCSAQRQRAEKAEGERDRARHLAADLEADNARLQGDVEVSEQSEMATYDAGCRAVRDETAKRKRAEARARRAEDALRWLRDNTKNSAMQRAIIDRALSTEEDA